MAILCSSKRHYVPTHYHRVNVSSGHNSSRQHPHKQTSNNCIDKRKQSLRLKRVIFGLNPLRIYIHQDRAWILGTQTKLTTHKYLSIYIYSAIFVYFIYLDMLCYSPSDLFIMPSHPQPDKKTHKYISIHMRLCYLWNTKPSNYQKEMLYALATDYMGK